MFFYVTEDRAVAERLIRDVLRPALNRPEDELLEPLLVGTAEGSARKLAAYKAAGVQRVFVWPVHDGLRQVTLFMEQVAPLVPA